MEGRLDDVLRLIEEQRWRRAHEALADWNAPDIADLVEQLDDRTAGLLIRALDPDRSAEVFANLQADQQEELLEYLTDDETQDLFSEMEPDDRTAVLEDLPIGVQDRVIDLLPAAEVAEAKGLLGYPEESVGRLMTPELIQLLSDMTLRQVLAHIRQVGADSETIARLYVTDDEDRLVGDVRLRAIILGDPETPVSAVLDADCARLNALDDREEAVRVMGRADVSVLPVVDGDGKLVGIVTSDDVFDVAEEEVTEDIQISAGVAPLETSYRRASSALLVRRRIVWLGSMVFVSLFAAGVIAAFEDTLTETIALVFFIPILMATGGNTGSQSSTLMVRALATDEVRMDEWARAFVKELAVGIALGIVLGGLAGIVGLVRSGTMVALVVMITMGALVLVANLLGMSLPFLLQRLRIDPAIASAPLITVLVDAIGLLIYFGTAAWLL